MAGLFGKGEANLNDAAARALWILSRKPNISEQEYMTLLFQDPRDNLYYHAPFQTQGLRDASGFDRTTPEARAMYGKDAGTVHNHPVMRDTDKISTTHFSTTDVAGAQELGVPAFLLATQQQGLPLHRRAESPAPDVQINRAQGDAHGFVGQDFLAKIPIDLMLESFAETNPLLRGLLNARKQNPALAAPFVGPIDTRPR